MSIGDGFNFFLGKALVGLAVTGAAIGIVGSMIGLLYVWDRIERKRRGWK